MSETNPKIFVFTRCLSAGENFFTDALIASKNRSISSLTSHFFFFSSSNKYFMRVLLAVAGSAAFAFVLIAVATGLFLFGLSSIVFGQGGGTVRC